MSRDRYAYRDQEQADLLGDHSEEEEEMSPILSESDSSPTDLSMPTATATIPMPTARTTPPGSKSSPTQLSASSASKLEKGKQPANRQPAPLPSPVMVSYAIPPRGGMPGAPWFTGPDVSDFLENYEQMISDYGKDTEIVKRLPGYCASAMAHRIKRMEPFKRNDWPALVEAMKAVYRETDSQQNYYTEDYLDRLISEKRSTVEAMEEYGHQFMDISDRLVEDLVISRLAQCRLFLKGLPYELRSRIIEQTHFQKAKPSTAKIGVLYTEFLRLLTAEREKRDFERRLALSTEIERTAGVNSVRDAQPRHIINRDMAPDGYLKTLAETTQQLAQMNKKTITWITRSKDYSKHELHIISQRVTANVVIPGGMNTQTFLNSKIILDLHGYGGITERFKNDAEVVMLRR